MATTIAIRFPLGRYHATPWDRSVNEGAAEWPPSPWRLLRALVATWYTRWPDLAAPVLDGLLDALGEPPSYLTPSAWPAHTRHYLPGLGHRKGDAGGTDLTFDPFLSLRRDASLLVRWGTDLGGEQRAALAKLAELLPYLGRADSVCEARLLDDSPDPDQTWWQPDAVGQQTVRLLSPVQPVSRLALETSTVQVRKMHRTLPPDTTWISYGVTHQAAAKREPDELREVQAIRFAVVSRAPVKSSHGILLADAVHQQGARFLAESGGADLLGGGGAATDHQHAHWLPIAEGTGADAFVRAIVVYVPSGLRAADVASLVRIRGAGGRRGSANGDGYEYRGLPAVKLLLQAVGPASQVAPELCEPARRWRSRTPYLPVRHRRRESVPDYLSGDVSTELRYRGLPATAVSQLDPDGRLPDRWALSFRRYRMNERLAQSRPGLGLRLEFAEPVAGPMLLGQLSHFGYGIFEPE
ncbi:MAG TPA: type I-U CRISPR-associated protein Csb2 [Streptosporangiaceae bacterium]|nr:type I-U CRISPR-associated protein Csb2 [Streptosporangiaceae bacterium]